MQLKNWLLLPLILLIFGQVAHTQTTGWDAVEKNDFFAARSLFEEEWKKNPNSESALTGLIFIAETLQDYENYKKYTNALMRSEWRPHYFWLFGHMFDGTPEEALKREWPEIIRVTLQAAQADTLFAYRKFKDAELLNNSVVPNWNWAVTGPFSNVAGSGFIETTPAETDPFNINQTFKNEDGVSFSWLKRILRAPGSMVDFDHLPSGSGLSTYYANTFLTIPTDRKVQIRLTRHEPMKIWLDGNLLTVRPKNTSGQMDLETLTLDLKAGTHRLLVKISEFPEDENTSKVMLAYNDVSDSDEGSGSGQRYGANAYGGQGGSQYRRFSGNGFIVRFCDPATGKMFTDITSNYEGQYTPTQPPLVRFMENEYLAFFKKASENHSKDLARVYLLAKAFAKTEAWEEGEEFFVRLAEKQPKSAFHNYLLAKFYDASDKGDRAEALLSSMDTVQTPTFAEHVLRLQKIDKEQNEPEYVGMLEHILALSPTNYGVLTQYLEFLKEKGKKEKVQGYVRAFLDKNKSPKWKERLEEYLEEDSYKPESYKPTTDKERDKNFKEAKKRLKTRFSTVDYGIVLDYYKNKEKVNDVLDTYDEMLEILTWSTYRRSQKAKYLFEKERYDEALTLLNSVLEYNPYDADIYETIGDIYIEKKNNTEALAWYRKSEKLNKGNRWGGGDLAEKIEKLENKKKFNGYFPTINLDEAAKDLSWKEKYKDEESVISLFTQQVTYKREENTIESVRKMVIHIQNEAGAKFWTEGDFRQVGRITSAKILKKDGTVTSPDMSYNYAVFKNLQPGDIILIEGNSEQGMPDEIPGEFLNIDVLSWKAPVAKSTLELLVPKDQALYFSGYRIETQPGSVRDTGEYKMYKWTWNDIAKLEEEEGAPQNLDAFAYLMTGSVPDWSKVVNWYNRKTYCRTDANYEVRDKARELITPGMTDEQKVEKLHNFVTKDINYSFVSFLNSNYTPKKAGQTLAGKVGDCKDVATLMISLLRDNGIDAWYVLAETHSFSNVEPRPTLYVFNHAIIAYQLKDGVLRYADLTTDYYPNGIVPEFDSDAWGLVIRDGETQLRRTPNHALDPSKSRVEINAKAVVDLDESVTLDVKTVNHGCPAGRWREELIPATPEDRRKKLSEYFGGGVLTHLDFETIDFENLEMQNDPLRLNVQMKGFNQLDKVAGFWIMPLPLPLSMPTHKALFAAKRYNDLDVDVLFELAPVRETVELTLPKGFSLLEMPQNQQISTKFGDYSLKFEKTAQGMKIQREMTFKQRYINHKDFNEFKKFYLAMLDADDAKIALKKI